MITIHGKTLEGQEALDYIKKMEEEVETERFHELEEMTPEEIQKKEEKEDREVEDAIERDIEERHNNIRI